MKYSLFALPALLRPAIILAAASQTAFSVHDDLLAFPQYEVRFSEDFVSESQARIRLAKSANVGDDAPPSHVKQYDPSDTRLGGDSRHDDDDDNDEKLEYESMVLDGQRYLCSIPQVKKPEPQSNANDTLSRAEEEKELARANDRGWELLSEMSGNCVYFISGWWSYKFCYDDGVRQFHQLPPSRGVPVYPPVEDPGVEGFMLGTYSKDEGDNEEAGSRPSGEDTGSAIAVSERGATQKVQTSAVGKLVQRGESRYLVKRLEGGTRCDLTGRDRRIEVQFHCNPQSADRITLIKETATCAYLMVVQTPRLCSDVAFLPPQKDQPNQISCAPVLAEEQVDDYKTDLQALKAAEQVIAAQAEAARVFEPKMVGDIAVGAHVLVPPDVKLEKSAIVGGGKETYIDTVASSGGKTVSKEDLERLGLGDARAVEELRKKLEKIAQGQEWKLDVIDTPRGREYRGIIGTEDDDEEKKKETQDEQGEDGEQQGSEEQYFKEEL